MSEYNLGPRNIVSLNGSPLSLASLELLITVANEHGSVLLVDVGKSSTLELGMALLEMAKRGVGTVPYPDVPTEDHPYTGDTPLPTRTRNVDEVEE